MTHTLLPDTQRRTTRWWGLLIAILLALFLMPVVLLASPIHTSTVTEEEATGITGEPTPTPMPVMMMEQSSTQLARSQNYALDDPPTEDLRYSTYMGRGRGYSLEGMTAHYYTGTWLSGTLVATELVTTAVDFWLSCFGETTIYTGCKLHPALDNGGHYSAKWTGWLVAPADGVYTFTLPAGGWNDDTTRIFLDDSLLVWSGDWEGTLVELNTATVWLEAGTHWMEIQYNQNMYYVGSLRVLWSGPGFAQEVIPAERSEGCYSTNDCCLNSACCTGGYMGGEIHTGTGNHNYVTTDIQVAGTAEDLTFQRTYASGMAEHNQAGLGYGWTHNYALGLSLPPIGPIIYVDPALGHDYPLCGTTPAWACRTIAYALTYQAEAGDTIQAAAGIYTESFSLRPGITVQGAPGHTSVISGGNARGPLVTATDAGVTTTAALRGFKLTAANHTGGQGGALYIAGASPAIINNVIVSNTADIGGGIYMSASQALLINNVVADNSATTAGSGVYIAGASHLVHTTLARNTGGNGTGVYIAPLPNSAPASNSTVWLTNTILVDHAVGVAATAGTTVSLEATLWGTDDWANTVDTSGTGTIMMGTVNIRDTPDFVAPTTGDYHLLFTSAAIDAGVATEVDTDMDTELRPGGYRGSADIGADEYFTARYVAVEGEDFPNAQTNDCRDAEVPCATIEHAVEQAVSGDWIRVASGIYTGVTTTEGQTQIVYVDKSVTIEGGYTTTNWTVARPGVWPTTLDAQGQGRGIYITGDITPTLKGLRITGGTADTGGGVYVDGATATLINNVIFDNEAEYDGGGMYARYSDLQLVNTTLVDNQVDAYYGSGMLIGSSTARLLHTTLARNTGGDGSGIYIADVGEGDVSSVALTNTILVSQTIGVYVNYNNAVALEATLWGTGTWANDLDLGGEGISSTGSINVWDAPAFADPDAGDYHIQATSAARDAGVAAGVFYDSEGTPRPEVPGSGYDIGADEYLTATTSSVAHTELETANLVGSVMFRTADGTEIPLLLHPDGRLEPYPGARVTTGWEGDLPDVTYVITQANQIVYRFDREGRPLQKVNAQGEVISFTHNAAGQLAAVTDVQSGRALTFTYNTTGQLIRVNDAAPFLNGAPLPNGAPFGNGDSQRTVFFEYDSAGDLRVVTGTRGYAYTYTYTGAHWLYDVVDPLGYLVERTDYDAQGRAWRQVNGAPFRNGAPSGTGTEPVVTLTYLTEDTTVYTDASGQVYTDTYDARGTLRSRTTPGNNQTTRVYDNDFNLTRQVDQAGHATLMSWGECNCTLERITDTLGNATVMDYDDAHHLTQMTDALGQVTHYGYEGHLLITTTDALSGTVVHTYRDGRLIQSVDHGLTTTYGYDVWGQRVALTDTTGNVTTYGYDAVGRLITTTASNGLVTVNVYDAGDNLVRVTRHYTSASSQQNYLGLYNLVTRYSYDAVGRRMWVTDTLGLVTRTGYDAAGQVVSTTVNYSPTIGQNAANTWNLITAYGYDALGRQILVTDTVGNVTRSWYDAAGRLVSTTRNYSPTVGAPTLGDNYANTWNLTTRYGYDAVGNQVWITDTLGHVTYTEYDALNRPLTVTVNYSTAQRADLNLTTAYAYDAVGNTLLVTDTAGHATRTEYDTLSRAVTVTANYVDGVYSIDSPDEDLTTLTVYDTHSGQVAARVQLSGTQRITTTYTYDALGRLVTTTNALGYPSVTHYDALGRRAATLDAEGHATTYTYDRAGRLWRTTDALSGTTTTTYDALGRRTVVTDALGHATTTVYDVAGRVAAQTDAMSGTTRYAYDALGRRTVVTDASGSATYFSYDAAGRLKTQRDALGHTTTYAYDALGQQTAITDANQVVNVYVYDAAGRLASVTENYTATGYSDAQTNLYTTYAYDQLGNRVAVTDALTHTTVYTYDGASRLVAAANAEGYVTTYRYDGLGRRVQQVQPDANGPLTTTTTYNALGWVTRVAYPATPGTAAFTVQYAYDKVGHRTALTDSTGTTCHSEMASYVYDALYRPLTITAPLTGTVAYAYDALGQRTALTLTTVISGQPAAVATTYAYDANQRLIRVTDWSTGTTTYAYDAAGRLLTTTLPNGITSTYRYDAAGRLVALEHRTAAALLARYAYTLDGVGNRVAVTETIAAPGASVAQATGATAPATLLATTPALYLPGPFLRDAERAPEPPHLLARMWDWLTQPLPTLARPSTFVSPLLSPLACPYPPAVDGGRVISYTYDSTARLTCAAYSTGECYQYGYDEVGNRAILTVTESFSDTTVTTYTYDTANRLTAVGGVAYTYDQRGNLTSDGAYTYTYDGAGRMVQVATPFATLVYTYNADGLRVAQNQGGVYQAFAWDWAMSIPELLSDGDQVYLVGHDTLGWYADGEWMFVLPDALGSVRQMADISGTVTGNREWSPFGVEDGSTQTGGQQTGLGYTGEWQDAYSALVYLRARWYEGDTGRFTQVDPWNGNIRQPYTLHQFQYVGNNPITLRDPSGFTNCNGWPEPFRQICEQADAGDLKTIERLYYLIALYAHGKGSTALTNYDFHLAGLMLGHFLVGNGNNLDLSSSWGNRIGNDPNINDAATLLFDAFMSSEVRSASQMRSASQSAAGASVIAHYDGLDFYTWENRPRPQSDGLYGGTGHVAVDGDFKAAVTYIGSCKYLVKFIADYSINDNYEWFDKTETNFGNVFGLGDIIIPHKWAIALRDASPPKAHQYHFIIRWSDRGRVLAESDWSDRKHLKWWEMAH